MNTKKLILVLFGSLFMLLGLHASESGSILDSQKVETKESDARKEVCESYGRFLNGKPGDTLPIDFGVIRDFDCNKGSGFWGLGGNYDDIRKVLVLVEHLEKQSDDVSLQFLKNVKNFYSMLFHKMLSASDIKNDKDARDLLSFCGELYALGNIKINTVLTKLLLVLWLINSGSDNYEARKVKFASAIEALRAQALEINKTALQASVENSTRIMSFFRLMNGAKIKEPMLKSNRWRRILIITVIVFIAIVIIGGGCWFCFGHMEPTWHLRAKIFGVINDKIINTVKETVANVKKMFKDDVNAKEIAEDTTTKIIDGITSAISKEENLKKICDSLEKIDQSMNKSIKPEGFFHQLISLGLDVLGKGTLREVIVELKKDAPTWIHKILENHLKKEQQEFNKKESENKLLLLENEKKMLTLKQENDELKKKIEIK